MEGDGLKTDEVVARGDRAWDGGSPGRVVGDHLAVSPLTVVNSARQETSFIDLEPLEAVGVDSSAGAARALCEVG